jgi:hypothetical protein
MRGEDPLFLWWGMEVMVEGRRVDFRLLLSVHKTITALITR